MKVFDKEKRERDLKYAEDKYGVAFRRVRVEPGQPVYRLVELWEKTGHHSLITQVLDEDGYPVANISVAFWWVDADDPPSPPTEIYPGDWYRNFVHGLTNANGDVGPGMGGGAWIDIGPGPEYNAIGGGPHAVWVRDPNIPSDICEKLGMRGGSRHDHLDQKFRLTIEGGNGPVPKGRFVEVEGSRTVDILPPEGIRQNHISIKCSGSPNFYDTRVDLRVGEDWRHPDATIPDPIYPAGLHHYNIGAIYDPVPGETGRTFWVLIRHAGTEELMSDPMPFGFNTGEGRRYAVRVAWSNENDPPPPPPPPPPPLPDPVDNLEAAFRGAAGLHRELAAVWDGAADILEAAKATL